jgi:hypothetical protein
MRLELGRLGGNDFHNPAECSYFSGQRILSGELASSPECFLSVTQQGSAANLGRKNQRSGPTPAWISYSSGFTGWSSCCLPDSKNEKCR